VRPAFHGINSQTLFARALAISLIENPRKTVGC
jgi:hypothetical protein